MKKALCVLFASVMLMGLAACRQSADTENPVPAEDPTESLSQLFSVYVPNDNADGFDVIPVHAETVSAETVLTQLKQQAVLPDAVSINERGKSCLFNKWIFFENSLRRSSKFKGEDNSQTSVIVSGFIKG